jgi:hypothetical protein
MQQEAPGKAAAGGSSSSSSGTNVYLTETLQQLKQANGCCRKLGLARQYALAPCSKPRWQLQHIAVEVWVMCEQQQQQQHQTEPGVQGCEGWQMKYSLTLGQFKGQLDKLLSRVAAHASQAPAAVDNDATASHSAAAAGRGSDPWAVHGGSSNCSSLFSSPAGSRPGSPSRSRPGSASAVRHTGMPPNTAAHGVPCGTGSQSPAQPMGWCRPGSIAVMAIPASEVGCRTSSRLSPRRRRQQQQQQQQQQQGDDADIVGFAVGSQGHGVPAAAQQHMAGSADAAPVSGTSGVAGVRAARGNGMLLYAVPAWLEEHL